MDYRQGSHTKFKIEYHFVWVTKYRYQLLQGDLALRVRELVRQTCERFEIQILRGVVSKDHVHILVSAPPDFSPRWARTTNNPGNMELLSKSYENYLGTVPCKFTNLER